MPNKTLYYDGQCPLCSLEMKHLKEKKSCDLNLVDIHTAALPEGKSKQALLTTLHCKVGDQWLTGLDATVAAWSETKFGWLFAWLRWPVIKPCADWVYARWAASRYRKLYASTQHHKQP